MVATLYVYEDVGQNVKLAEGWDYLSWFEKSSSTLSSSQLSSQTWASSSSSSPVQSIIDTDKTYKYVVNSFVSCCYKNIEKT